MARMSNKTKGILGIVGGVLALGLAGMALGVSLNVAGVFEPKEIKTDTEISVKFNSGTNFDNATGIKLFYDDKGTEDTADDTYYRMVRYSETTEGHLNYQKDGLLIMDETGKWYAFGACDLSETVTIRVKSTYDKKEESRETQLYVNGKKVELKAEGTLTEESPVTFEKGVMTDTRESCPAGSGIRVDGTDGIVYYIED